MTARRLLLLLAAAAVSAAAPPPAPPPASGLRPAAPAAGVGAPRTYVVRLVNGRPLPFRDRFTTTPGYEHRVHLERFLVRLAPDGTFTLTVWGAYRDAPRGAPAADATGGAGSVRDAEARGRWTRRGDQVTLTPAPSRRGRRYAPAEGRLTPAGLELRYEIGWAYPAGQFGSRRYQLTAAHDPSYL